MYISSPTGNKRPRHRMGGKLTICFLDKFPLEDKETAVVDKCMDFFYERKIEREITGRQGREMGEES